MSFIYPVIHHDYNNLTLEQADIAHSLGADGVFLISHGGEDEVLPILGIKIKQKYPDFKIGLNLLSTHILKSVEITKDNKLDMVWGDYCGVSSEGLDEVGEKLQLWVQENSIELFASVAFKYQKTDPNPPLAAATALSAGFIPTTSGSGTGTAPSVEKIQSMSEVTNGLLAVASGMSVENIDKFKPYLSHILVSTGVSKDSYRFDEEKLSLFIQKIKNS